MRGWLCRRKWKIIVQDYICSPHAESMRKRNQIVFNMVEAETEYVHQLSILVNCFLRPLRMAASSKKPPISHDDVSSIFLNRCVRVDFDGLENDILKTPQKTGFFVKFDCPTFLQNPKNVSMHKIHCKSKVANVSNTNNLYSFSHK